MPIDMNQLDELFATAAARANAPNSTLEQINTAAQIAKAASDARKSAVDAVNSYAQMRLEGLKSLATFLVPIVSLLTIAFTVWIQYQQLQETQRQDEATQWRDFLTSAKTSVSAIQSDPTFAPRLRSFFSSPTYRDQAISISKRLMGGIADSAGFSDLFDVTFGALDSQNFADVVDVGRLLYTNVLKSYSSCQQFFDSMDNKAKKNIPNITESAGICSRLIPDKNIRDLGLDGDHLKALVQLRHDTISFEDEINVVSVKISDFLRSNYAVGSTPARGTILLNRIYIYGVDLSNIDFSSFDISDTVIDTSTLTGAKLTPKKYGYAMDIRSTKWWEVSEIDQGALEGLLGSEYPNYTQHEPYPDNIKVDKKHYEERVSALCIPMKPFCQPDKLKFGQ